MSEGYLRGVEKSETEVSDVSALAAAAANELSSPLILLRQLSFALSQDNLSEGERLRLSRQMTLTSERALRLTANLSTSVPDQAVLALEPINPVSVCREVVHELTPLFAAYEKKITLQARTRIPLSIANHQVLQQILLSFGDSALHYGSIDHPIRMTVSGRRDRVRIGVRDHGPAVSIDTWERLEGKIAKRAKSPLATRSQASSISLLAAKRLAEAMGAAVGMIRHRDGATFYVDLRLSDQMSLL